MLTSPLRLAGALLTTFALAAPLSAQDASVTDYTPKQITTGTVITIQGDFAAKTTGNTRSRRCSAPWRVPRAR